MSPASAAATVPPPPCKDTRPYLVVNYVLCVTCRLEVTQQFSLLLPQTGLNIVLCVSVCVREHSSKTRPYILKWSQRGLFVSLLETIRVIISLNLLLTSGRKSYR